MATVRFSKTLRSDILSAARDLFSNSMRDAIMSFDINDYAEDIYRAVVPNVAEAALSVVPRSFLSYVTDLRVIRAFGTPLSSRNDIKFVSPRVWPTELDRSLGAVRQYSTTNVSLIVLHSHPQLQAVEEALKKRDALIHSIEQQRNALVNEVDKLLNKHATLSPALREWPALWELLSDDVKEQHKRIVDKTGKEREDVQVDLSTATAILAINRINR